MYYVDKHVLISCIIDFNRVFDPIFGFSEGKEIRLSLGFRIRFNVLSTSKIF